MEKIYFKNKKNIVSGFTLVETLVAISIFTVSILALISVLTSSISNTYYAKQKMIATYLAQEGIEYFRNMRDTYVVYDSTSTQTGWDAFKSKVVPSAGALCASANGCYFNADNINYSDSTKPMIDIILTACSSSSCPNGTLLYNSTTGKYGFTGTNSGFIRKILVSQISANETKIFSTVSWKQGSGDYSITFSESLFNWIE